MGRFLVGVDLGTTHTVVAFAPKDAPDASAAQVLPIAQLVTATAIEGRELLSSALYAPVSGESVADPWGDAPWVVGELARRRGAEVPGRLVASAKSWLCHAGVDRTAAILPWGAAEDDEAPPRISPVEASARVLRHVRAAWDQAFPSDPLDEQTVVLTVPASFDEVARELTAAAAERAGLAVRLLEEPQAAFYDWMAASPDGAVEALLGKDAEALVLVCDVGGGTTDLSLLRVARGEDGVTIDRVAVGRHLLLGGDNMDLALAHALEPRLAGEGERLDARRFGQLVLSARTAKERLLGLRAPPSAAVAIAGAGSKLVGATRTAEVSREDAERIVLEGFFPMAPRDARPERARSGLVAFGLPYERDVAITRHVAQFFAKHAAALGPRALLLNGGVFKGERIAARLAEAIQAWGGPKLTRLARGAQRARERRDDLDLAVARGAVAFALATSGRGRRIGGGAARGYYVGLGEPDAMRGRQAVCVVPRGAPEAVPQLAAGRTFALVVGRPARFELFASDEEASHPPGTIVVLDPDRFDALPAVTTMLDALPDPRRGPGDSPSAPPPSGGRRRRPVAPLVTGQEVRVALEGELTPIGTLDLACVEIVDPGDDAPSPRRFRLAFQLRAPADDGPRASARPPPSKRLDEAPGTIDRAFGPKPGGVAPDARDAKNLVRELERLLGERATWTTDVARDVFDALWLGHRTRRRTPDHERVFWQLAGFTLRPGFGAPADDRRVAALDPLFTEALAFPKEVRGWQQFWIAWRRVAGGLDEAQQTAVRDAIDPLLAPAEAKLKKPKLLRPDSPFDLLDLASSLERAPAARRAELGAWILERTWTDREPRLWSALGRLGARVPAYASVHHVVAPHVVERWLDHLLRDKWDDLPTAPAAAAQMARVTGDRARDVSERIRDEVARRLERAAARPEWIQAVRELVAVAEADKVAFFGESLPVGLRLVE